MGRGVAASVIRRSPIDVPRQIRPDLVGEPLESMPSVFGLGQSQRFRAMGKMTDECEQLIQKLTELRIPAPLTFDAVTRRRNHLYKLVPCPQSRSSGGRVSESCDFLRAGTDSPGESTFGDGSFDHPRAKVVTTALGQDVAVDGTRLIAHAA